MSSSSNCTLRTPRLSRRKVNTPWRLSVGSALKLWGAAGMGRLTASDSTVYLLVPVHWKVVQDKATYSYSNLHSSCRFLEVV